MHYGSAHLPVVFSLRGVAVCMTQESFAPEPRKRKKRSRGNRALQNVRRLERKQKQLKALALVRSGKSHSQIATLLGCSPSTISVWIREQLQQAANAADESGRELAQLQYDRCEDMIEALYDSKDVARVAEVLIKIMDRQARLKGFDRPTEVKHTITVEQMSRDELIAEARKLGIAVEDAEYTLLSTPQELPGLLADTSSLAPGIPLAEPFLEVTSVSPGVPGNEEKEAETPSSSSSSSS